MGLVASQDFLLGLSTLNPMGTHDASKPKALYLDYQSTTPVDPSVLEAMLPFFSEEFGNAHSTSHAYGWSADAALTAARGRLASALGAQAQEIVFTSGATEATHTAILGLLARAASSKPHLISVATEHKATLGALAHAQADFGATVTLLAVGPDGQVDPEAVADAITDDTVLVSVMGVNNETGVIQPIQKIAKLCSAKNVVFHTDLAQAVGRIPIHLARSGIGLASLSAHKVYGPMGIGALYCCEALQARLTPMLRGGGQEQGIRSGTVPVALAVGFGEAVSLVSRRRTKEAKRLAMLESVFLDRLRAYVPGVSVNAANADRVAGCLNLHFRGIDAEALLGAMPGVAVSLGSACTSAAPEPSHVLTAMGLDYESVMGSIRLSFGAPTTEEQALFAADHIGQAVKRLGAAA
ncbi:MAG: cysteine desulfurase family protein [Pseudomonadota bacterium]